MSYTTGFYDGRLGIGLSSSMGINGNPRYPLDVNGDIRLTGAIIDGSGQILSMAASESNWIIDPSSNISFSSGNVGIGTSSPGAYKLNVNGSFNCTSLNVGGAAFEGGFLSGKVTPVNSSIYITHSDSSPVNPTGQFNTSLGPYSSYAMTSGTDNVSIGYATNYSINTGVRNIAIGRNANQLSTNGQDTIAIGYQAGFKGTNGQSGENVFIGNNVVDTYFTSTANVCIGHNAGKILGGSTYSGSYGNVFVGHNAGAQTGNAYENVAVGRYALYRNLTGYSNIAIGYYQGPKAAGSAHNNRLYIGNISSNSGEDSFIYGNMSSGSETLKINADLNVNAELQIKGHSALEVGELDFVEQVNSNPGTNHLTKAAFAGNTNMIAVGRTGSVRGIFYHNGSTSTWTHQVNQTVDAGTECIAVSRSGNACVVGYRVGGASGAMWLWRSTNKGVGWSMISFSTADDDADKVADPNRYWHAVGISEGAIPILYQNTTGKVWLASNATANPGWSDITSRFGTGKDIRSFTAGSSWDGLGFYAPTGNNSIAMAVSYNTGEFFYTNNAWTTVTNRGIMMTGWTNPWAHGGQGVCCSIDGTKIYTFSTSYGVIKSTDFGQNWTQVSTFNQGHGGNTIDCSLDGKVVVSSRNTGTTGIQLSTDYGATWTTSVIPNKPDAGLQVDWVFVRLNNYDNVGEMGIMFGQWGQYPELHRTPYPLIKVAEGGVVTMSRIQTCAGIGPFQSEHDGSAATNTPSAAATVNITWEGDHNYEMLLVSRRGTHVNPIEYRMASIGSAGSSNYNSGVIALYQNSPTSNAWSWTGTSVYLNANGSSYFDGQLGIGERNSDAPLHVGTGVSNWIPNYWQYGFVTGGSTNYTAGYSHLVGIKANWAIWTTTSFFATSDERIKKNIVDVPDDLALQMVRDIPCRYYEYKDQFRGIEKTIGFIAQEVKEVLPMAISIEKDIIPNEMRNLENISWEEIVDISNNTFKLTTDLQNVSGVKYRFYVSNDPSGNDEEKKEVVGNEDGTFTFDKKYEQVFCYGKEVDDFHILDKQKIFSLHHSAIQEIDRQQQADKVKIAQLENKVALLESELAAIKTHLGI